MRQPQVGDPSVAEVERERDERLVSPFRCTSPRSVTRVSPRVSDERLTSPFRWREPAVVDRCTAEVKIPKVGHTAQMRLVRHR